MKLEKYGVIAEIISSVAIIVTLVILVTEVRGNTEAIRAQTAQATFGTSTESFYYAEGNAALAKAETDGWTALTVDERAHAEALMSAIFNSFDSNYYQYRHGTLDEEIHEAYISRLQGLMSIQVFQDKWIRVKQYHTKPFQVYVDEIAESLEE